MKSSIGVYLEEIGRYPLLSTDEEILLGRRIQTMRQLLNEKPEGSRSMDERRAIKSGQKAMTKMMQANLRLVVSVAKKFVSKADNLELLDLIQEGNIGLARGAELFDPERGYKFSTYAYWWIRQAISRAIQQTDRMVRVPIHKQESVNRCKKYAAEVLQRAGKLPSLEECCKHLNLNPADMEDALTMQVVYSLDAQAGNSNEKSPIIELIVDDRGSSAFDEMMLERDVLKDALNHLDDREQEIVRLYAGLNDCEKCTLTEISKRLYISRERVRQIYMKAQRKMRRYINRASVLQRVSA